MSSQNDQPKTTTEKVPGAPTLRSRLMFGGMWAFGARLASILAALASNVLLARLLSPEELGSYFLAFSIVTVVSLLSLLGLDQAVIRFVGESVSLGQFKKTRHLFTKILIVGGLGAFGTGLVYLLIGPLIGDLVFDSSVLVAVTGLIAAWIAIMAVQTLFSACFRALQDIRFASIFYSAASGTLLAFLLGILWFFTDHLTLNVVLYIAVFSGLGTTLVAGWILYRKVSSLPVSHGVGETVELGKVMWVAMPMLVANATVFILTQADLWIIGAFRSQQEVALYGAAARAVFLVPMITLVMQAVVQPLVVDMYTQDRKQELERILRALATVALIPSLMIAVGFIFFGGEILGLIFGEFYSRGAVILALLSIAQLTSVWSGMCGIVLTMTGHQTVMMIITIVGSLVTIAGGLFAVVLYGTTGVAVATLTGITITNLGYWITANRRTGIWTHAGFVGFADLARTLKRSVEQRTTEIRDLDPR